MRWILLVVVRPQLERERGKHRSTEVRRTHGGQEEESGKEEGSQEARQEEEGREEKEEVARVRISTRL